MKIYTKIYTIFGTTGEYSDKCIWAIASYYNEELAKVHVIKATEKANEWEVSRKNKYANPPEGFSKYDLKLTMDSTGTNYYYVTTDIIDSI